ncbi:MAG: 50S ribosomal protein L24 [Legionellaceae bacterium]|nr:50S ribosomal protein L24 [Legionellaceae bacterium]|tara:strand:- start:262 stop:588 length:327 start_codon:yes stop_codon:yes gene_type:complete
MKRIRSGDTVIVIAGKSKGHIGKVSRVQGDAVIVEGGNVIKKHVKPNPQLQIKGGIQTQEAPIHVSNVAIYNNMTKAAGKIGFKYLKKDGVDYKVRYFKSNNEVIDSI